MENLIRDYALGKQDIQKYKIIIGTQKLKPNKDFMKIDWVNHKIMKSIRNRMFVKLKSYKMIIRLKNIK